MPGCYPEAAGRSARGFDSRSLRPPVLRFRRMAPRPHHRITGTPEQLAVVAEELRRQRDNSAYWMSRNFLVSSNSEVRPLVLDPVTRLGQWKVRQAEREQLRRRGKSRLYVLKGRRAGVTTWAQAENAHEVHWHEPRNVWTFAHTDAKVSELFEITKLAYERYPQPALIPPRIPRDAAELSFRHNSHFRIGTAGSVNIGRGSAINRAHVSEFAFVSSPIEFLKGLLPAVNEIDGSRVVLETTASAFGSPAHEEWKKAVAGKSNFEALFLPWWECRPADYRQPLLDPDELGELSGEERALVERHGLGLEQIKWRRERMLDPGGESGFLQEFAEDDEGCWEAGEGLRFDAATLRLLVQHAESVAPVVPQAGDTPALYYQEGSTPLGPGERAIIGADVAEGGGGDSSVWVAREFKSWRPIASFSSAYINPEDYGGHLAKWGRELSDDSGQPAFLVPERTGLGSATLRALRDTAKYPLRSIYHRAPIDSDREKKTDRLGWHTSGGPTGTKHLLVSAFESWIADCRNRLNGRPSEPVGLPLIETLRDAFAVQRADGGAVVLNGRDHLVAESLALMGRSAPYLTSAFGSLKRGEGD